MATVDVFPSPARPSSFPDILPKSDAESSEAAELDKESGFANKEFDKFEYMLEWLKDNGGTCPDLCLQKYDDEFRGVHMKNSVSTGTIVLEVPHNILMTSEVAMASEIGQAIINSGVSLLSSHSYLACFLLQERLNPKSFWKPYIDILPVDYRNMPIFFTPEELSWLQGSFALDKRLATLRSLEREYNNLYKALPQFSAWNITLRDFIWARTAVITRVFGFNIGKHKTDGLVPMADMLNHKTPKETIWTFDNERNSFTMTASEDLPAGQQVYDTYGSKCNSRFLVNYGFAIDDNFEDNEALVNVNMSTDAPNYSSKSSMLSSHGYNRSRSFQIGVSYKHDEVKSMFSYLRYVCSLPSELSAASCDSDVNPLSISNEMAALDLLVSSIDSALSKFATSMEEDNAILADENSGISRNLRNCVVMRRGEKQVLHHWRAIAMQCSQLLSKTYDEAAEAAAIADEHTACYINQVLLRLLRFRRI